MVSKTFAPKSQPSAFALGRLASNLPWQRLSLVAVLILAAFLNVFRLSSQGLGNTYYTAAVTSMVQNWHAFFFARSTRPASSRWTSPRSPSGCRR